MAENTKTFKVCSFNFFFIFNDLKSAYLAKLLSDNYVLRIQEHWLHSSTVGRLMINPSTSVTAAFGMADSDILVGRPYGGTAIMWSSKFDACVRRITCKNKRI